jgi:SAM-dependent methyltransferase
MNVLGYDPGLYYQGHFWNDYPYVRDELNRRLSGDTQIAWYQHLQRTLHGRRFRKALMLNCGNGWVERELLAVGVIDEAVGIDYAEPLLAQARQAAASLPLRYYQCDTNRAAFPEEGYDLVVNHAAAHHITYVDRVFRAVAQLLPTDGYFVHFDYVGPHRNQYAEREWHAIQHLNRSLPMHLRQRLRYPHLLTPRLLDPSEAIHSELILPVLRRYFTLENLKWLGGALAYPVLAQNEQFWQAPEAEQSRWLPAIMEADTEHLVQYPEASLFAYILAYPKRDTLENQSQLAAWTREELAREQRVRRTFGFYYRPHLRLSLRAFGVSVGDVALRTLRRWQVTFTRQRR